LVEKIGKSRKYKTTKKGMDTIIAVLTLTQKTIPTILSSINKDVISANPEEMQKIDRIFMNIRNEIKEIHQIYGINTAA
jgi:histidine ammonia-lyase